MSLSTIPSTVLKIINKYGTTVYAVFQTNGSYDPTTSSSNNFDAVPIACKGIIEEFADGLRGYGDKEKDNYVAGDKKLTIAGSAFAVAPAMADKFLIKNVAYSIIAVSEVNAQDNIAYYVYRIRKA